MTKEALGKLIISSEDMLFRVGMSILGKEVDVEDAIQNAIVKAFTHVGDIRKDEYARTYLVRILINECYELRRKMKPDLPFEAVPEKGAYEERPDYAPLYRSLLALPEELRMILTLYYGDEFTVKEIAEMLSLPEGTVKSRLFRAREALRAMMSEEEL